MEELLQFFTQIDFNWSIIETVAVFFSIVYVILATKENIWCWGAATINVLLYIYICYTAQLYPETTLQVFYLLMAFYGFYNWKKQNKALQITEWSISKHLSIIALAAVLVFFMGFYFVIYTDAAMPIIDSFTTVFAVFATYMVTQKIVSNWLYWIVIDTVSIYLYFSRDLHLTALLFFAYTIIAIFGYFKWQKLMQ
ncbi:MAG: nicotinamide riboside transporter PnuC [Bacteroidota bacterium]|nr:nicotinamide riboside transporter PnuC [Bacteroidota bacterium]